jgi:hypothetical protein
MAFPATPLDLEVGLFIDGEWVDAVTTGNGVREADQVTVTHGRSNWAAVADPGRASFTLDNRDGRWSPDWSGSPYAGLLRRNIPCRVGVGRGEMHLRPTDVGADLASTPDISGGGGGGTPTAPAHASVTQSTETTATTTHDVAMPATVAATNRLLLVISASHATLAPKDQGGGVTDLDDWTLVESGNLYTPWHGWACYEIEVTDSTMATALAGSTVQFSTSVGAVSSAQVIRTTGARSGGEGTAWEAIKTATTSFSAAPDSPSLTTTWAAEPVRWYSIAIFGSGGDDVTNWPSSYTSIADTGGATNLNVASAHRTTTAATENPGAFTLAGSENWQALTFVYRGTEVAGADGVLDIAGDIDVRVEFELEKDLINLTDGGRRARLAHKSSGADGWEWELYAAGGVVVSNFSWKDSAGTAKNSTTEATGAALPLDFLHEHRALRVTLDVNNGASGHTVTWYTSTTIGGTWTALGSPVVVAGTTSIKTNDARLRVGGNPGDGTHIPLPGKVYAFELRNGIAGTVVANPAFNAQAAGATGFTDGAGRVWTIGTGGRITNMLWRFHGELASLPVRWNVDGSDVTAPVEAAGIFRRLRQGTRGLESAIRRAMYRASNLVQYWPLEEESDGTIARFGPAVGEASFVITGGTPNTAAVGVFACSSPLPTLDTASITVDVDTYTSATSAWQVRWLQNIPTTFTGDNLRYLRVETTDMTWEVEYRDDSGGQLQVHALRGLSTVYSSGWIAFAATGQAWRMTLSVAQAGSTVDVVLLGQAQGGAAGGITDTAAVTGAAGLVNRIKINGAGNVPSWAFGHVTLQSAVTSSTELATELNAYNGERAATRIQRLLLEEGIPYRIEGNPADTESMGPQRPATLMSLLQECADTDLGILHESRETTAVGYRTRASMLDQPVIIDLDYAAGEVAESPELDRDDQDFANDVTVRNRAGNTARAVLDDGSPLSVSEPPVGAGRYDTTYLVNAQDNRLPALAASRLALTTVDEPRVSRLALALHHNEMVANSALTSAIFDASLGDRVQVSNNLTVALGTATIDQLMQGTRDRIGSFSHRIDMFTTPSSPWFVGGGVEPPSEGHTVTFRTGQALATPGTPEHVLTALGYTDTAPIARADLDGILDDWLATTGGTLRTFTSAATFTTAIAAARPGDLLRCTSSFTISSGQLQARGNLYSLSGTTLTASPTGGSAGLPIIITCADGVEVTGSGLTNSVPVLDLMNCRHVWAVGFNVAGTSQFGIRSMNHGGTAGAPAYVAYCQVDEIRDASIAAQGWFQLITSSGGTPPAGTGNEWGFSEFLVIESNTMSDPNPGDVAGNAGEGVYLGRGGAPGWVSYAKDCWVRGNLVTNYKANGYEAKAGCHRVRFTDNVAIAGRGQNGAAFEMCYQASGITSSRPAWTNNLDGAGSGDVQIYVEGSRVYDYNITEVGTTRNQAFIVGMAGVRLANNMLWSARDSAGNFGTGDNIYAVLIQSELTTTDFGNTATQPTWIVNNNWQARAVTNLGSSSGAITGVISRNNITASGYGGEFTAGSSDYITTTPAVGTLSAAEWETYGVGSAFDLAVASSLVGTGASITDLDLYIDADISQRAINASAPNPGPFQPHPANA